MVQLQYVLSKNIALGISDVDHEYDYKLEEFSQNIILYSSKSGETIPGIYTHYVYGNWWIDYKAVKDLKVIKI